MSVYRKKKKGKKMILIMVIVIVIGIILLVQSLRDKKTTQYSLDEDVTYYYGVIEKYIEDADNIEIIEDSKCYTLEPYYIIEINNNNNQNYELSYLVNDKKMIQNIEKGKTELKFELTEEKEYNLELQILKDGKTVLKWNKNIFYIKPYEKQFLDNIKRDSVAVHITGESMETGLPQTIELMKSIGVSKIRADAMWSWMDFTGELYFTLYDEKFKVLNDNGIEILCILNTNTSMYNGEDGILSTEEELKEYANFVDKVSKRYPYIYQYEIGNEPNFSYYSEEGMKAYAEIVKIAYKTLKNNNPKSEIISGATVQNNSEDFFKGIFQYGAYKYSDTFSYHAYAMTSRKDIHVLYDGYMSNHKEFLNSEGGFNHFYITETGISNGTSENVSEEAQAKLLIQEAVLRDKYSIEESTIYNFRDTNNDQSSKESNFGIIENDYTPKLSYYALKNYYENTNGAEYIGTINLADGIEAHVYNKDGKTKIIAWTTDTNYSETIPYKNFMASDMYGNDIENTDGTLTITSSPIYLDNVSNSYFYQAISNTAIEKYNEFEEKFSEQISKVEGLSAKVAELKTYMTNIANNETEIQENALKQMSEHFALGDTLLNAYENGILEIEYITLSSMLDMLNDIGNSYEDLVTVSATIREGYFEATNNLIQEAENKINNNSDLEIVYPTKILDFAKELDEKAEYILSLEEENDIKTGLIVSNSLHAYYLANWANRFAQLYINDDIKNNPVTISYSETELTKQNVTVTLNVPQGTTITNNEGKNTYVFEQNDKFTFEYERRGQAFTIETQVSNIDKNAPSIRGVIDGKIYISNVSFEVYDANLEKVEVTFNDTLMEYENGQQLSEEGIYHITATDKAENITELEFYIVEEVTDDYIIKDSYLLNIKQNTSMTNFITKFGMNGDYQIIRNKETLKENDIVATGDILELENGQQYTIIVAGDINKDGKVTPYDYTALLRTILRLRELNEIEALAADINLDNKEIGVKDYTRMRIELLGEY